MRVRVEVDLFGEPIKKKPKYKAHIYLWSGGKDSTVMVDRALRDGKQIDYIVYSDVLIEFDEMKEYISKTSNYWEQRYNKKVTFLKPQQDFDSIIFNVCGENGMKCTNQANHGKISGLLNPTAGFCEWRSRAKIYPFERFIKTLGYKRDDILVYVGFTLDEPNRTKRHKHEAYPLIDEYKMREADCKNYLIENEMENHLYRHFNRTGCRFCPYQSELDFYNIWKYYPNVWKEYKEYEKKVAEHKKEAINQTWFVNYQTCSDMEKKFEKYQNLGFYPSDEPLKNCFCKI